jgi:hypothetical protein
MTSEPDAVVDRNHPGVAWPSRMAIFPVHIAWSDAGLRILPASNAFMNFARSPVVEQMPSEPLYPQFSRFTFGGSRSESGRTGAGPGQTGHTPELVIPAG